MCGIDPVEAQGCGCMFTFCHAYLKMGVLLHKMAIVCNQKLMAVSSMPSNSYFSFFVIQVNLVVASVIDLRFPDGEINLRLPIVMTKTVLF